MQSDRNGRAQCSFVEKMNGKEINNDATIWNRWDRSGNGIDGRSYDSSGDAKERSRRAKN